MSSDKRDWLYRWSDLELAHAWHQLNIRGIQEWHVHDLPNPQFQVIVQWPIYRGCYLSERLPDLLKYDMLPPCLCDLDEKEEKALLSRVCNALYTFCQQTHPPWNTSDWPYAQVSITHFDDLASKYRTKVLDFKKGTCREAEYSDHIVEKGLIFVQTFVDWRQTAFLQDPKRLQWERVLHHRLDASSRTRLRIFLRSVLVENQFDAVAFVETRLYCWEDKKTYGIERQSLSNWFDILFQQLYPPGDILIQPRSHRTRLLGSNCTTDRLVHWNSDDLEYKELKQLQNMVQLPGSSTTPHRPLNFMVQTREGSVTDASMTRADAVIRYQGHVDVPGLTNQQMDDLFKDDRMGLAWLGYEMYQQRLNEKKVESQLRRLISTGQKTRVLFDSLIDLWISYVDIVRMAAQIL